MKNNKKVFFTVVFFCSLLIGIKIFKDLGVKKSEFKSEQKILTRNEKSFSTPITVSSKEETVKVIEKSITPMAKVARTSRKVALAGDLRRGLFSEYLTESKNGYQYSDNIYAVFKKNYRGNPEHIVGEYLGYLLVESDIEVEDGFKLIKHESEKRVGVFMEKIVLVHEKSDEFENKLKELSGAISFYYLSGVYFIESKSVEDSIDFLASFKQKFPNSQADLDIQYSRLVPK